MDKRAIELSKLKLERAKCAASRLGGSTNIQQQKDAWSDFLMATSSIYSKLEQGAKVSGSSKGWFGRKKAERRNDPLLRYIHHARDVDHHGLCEVTAVADQGVALAYGDEFILSYSVENPEAEIKGGTTHFFSLDGEQFEPPTLVAYEKELGLVTVTHEVYHDRFEPPFEHLGKQIRNPTPTIVADMAIDYLEALIEEAAKLVQK